jgi:hypothetical protein
MDYIKEEVAPIYPAYLRRPMVFSPDGYPRIPVLNSFPIDPRGGYRSFKQVFRNAGLPLMPSCLTSSTQLLNGYSKNIGFAPYSKKCLFNQRGTSIRWRPKLQRIGVAQG